MADNYNNFTYIPTDEVSLSLICRVLGVRSSSVPYVLCSKKINKHSRRKPYKNIGSWGVQLYGVNGNNETQIIQHNFGLTPKPIIKPVDGTETTEGCAEAWGQWERPNPTEENVFKRMDDMCGYWHLAVPDIQSFEYSSGKRPSLIPYTADFWVKVTFCDQHRDRIVTLNDISYNVDGTLTKLENMYLTVVMASYQSSSSRWGAKWIVAQSTNTLGNAVTPPIADTAAANYIQVKFNLFKAGIDNLMNDFGKHFIAVGFAKKFESNTAKSDGTNTIYYYTSPNNNTAMPLTLVNPDMYASGIQVASIGALMLNSTGENLFDVYVDLYATSLQSLTYANWRSGVVKNGKTGCSVSLAGQFKCEIVEVDPEEAKEDGYLVFYLTVTTDIGLKGFYIVTQKGCEGETDGNGKKYIALSLVGSNLQVIPGQADYTNSEVKDSIDWLKRRPELAEDDAELMTGIEVFVPGATEITGVTLEIMGIPSGWVSNNVLVPDVKTKNSAKKSYDFSISGF